MSSNFSVGLFPWCKYSYPVCTISEILIVGSCKPYEPTSVQLALPPSLLEDRAPEDCIRYP